MASQKFYIFQIAKLYKMHFVKYVPDKINFFKKVEVGTKMNLRP